jgi:hypothetical protein
MSSFSEQNSGFVRAVVFGCGALALVAVTAAHFLERNADQQIARAQQGAGAPARSLAALPRPQPQQQAQGSWFFGRRTDPNAVGTPSQPKIGNTITNPELGMPR